MDCSVPDISLLWICRDADMHELSLACTPNLRFLKPLLREGNF